MNNTAEKQRSIKTPDWLVPGYPPLKVEDPVGQAAVEGQLWYYPKVVRTMIDSPIPGQCFSLISFMLFKEPRKLRNGCSVYGYLKTRGNWADKSQSQFEASKIIREVDSKYIIRIAPTGAWVPITDEDAFIKEKLDVKMSENEFSLRDEVVKEKEAKQRRIQREIREREEELKQGDIYDDPTSLKYYSMKRVTEMRLMETRDNLIRQTNSIKLILRKVQMETKLLELDYPKYIYQWIDCYNKERRKAGVPDHVPSEEQEREHKEVIFDPLERSDKEEKI